jgi:uncharacterized ubiquitin-like protein YukD
MSLPNNIVVKQVTGTTIKVTNQNQVLSTQAPVTLRNTAADYNAIDRLTDVDLTEREDGSTLVYNASTDKYEVKPITEALTGLDGGTF